MTIAAGRHYPKDLMRCSARPPERYGNLELSVQASRFHASNPRNGCGHTPLGLYERVEVALRWVSTKHRIAGCSSRAASSASTASTTSG